MLIAANRWEQMQSLSFSLPPKNENRAVRPCAMNGIQPGDITADFRGPSVSVNCATNVKLEEGRNAKQNFYGRFAVSQLPDFAQHFDEIAAGTSHLSGKMAVFYADGNRFGKIQTACCKSPKLQALWDSHIRASRDSFMKGFLEEAAKDPTWLSADGKLRFETLLWGGDELLFVMPAEKGWDFSRRFFEHFERCDDLGKADASKLEVAEWQDAFFPKGTPPLTYTASLVFCHHHAPIARIKHLAKDKMADEFAKEVNRDRNQLVVQVLESFDHLGTNYMGSLKKRYGDELNPESLILAGDSTKGLAVRLKEIGEHVGKLKSSNAFPRNQLRKVVLGITREKKSTDLATVLGDHFPEMGSDSEEKRSVDMLHKLIAPEATCWVQMEELWDYARI
jgi:hypothetical protein